MFIVPPFITISEDKSHFTCLYCKNKKYIYNNQKVQYHINRDKHKKSLEKHNIQTNSTQMKFEEDLVNVLSKCNLPFSLLDDKTFRDFMEINTNFTIPYKNDLHTNQLLQSNAEKKLNFYHEMLKGKKNQHSNRFNN